MYTDHTLQPIQDDQPYTAPNGTQYPANFPKANIPGLHPVTLAERPDDPALVVTGFAVNGDYEQVWQTRYKTAEEITTELEAYLPAYRYQREVGGITVNGITLKTDEDSQRKLTAIKIEAEDDAGYTVDFKAQSGWVTLNATQCIALARAVSAHIKQCFKAERAVDVSQYTTAAEVEAAFDAAYSQS